MTPCLCPKYDQKRIADYESRCYASETNNNKAIRAENGMPVVQLGIID